MPIEITGPSLAQSSPQRETTPVQVGRQQANVAQQQTGQPSSIDTVSLSNTANLLQKLESILANLPVMDAQRIASIKKALANGSYSLDPERTATNLMSLEQALKDLHST